jgi:zinc protease
MIGRSSPKDLETFLQLIHLGFIQPKFDTEIFNENVKTFKSYIKNNQDTAKWKFNDELVKTMFPGNFWLTNPTLEDARTLDAEASRRNLLERFQSSNDFTLQFVGNFEEDWVKPLILKYVASLPSGKKEIIKNMRKNPAKGKLKVVVNENLEEKSEVIVILHNEIPYSEKNYLAFNVVTSLLNIKIKKEIREKQGLIYSGGVYFGFELSPKPYSRFIFRTLCNPRNVDKVISEYRRILTELKTDLVEPQQLEGVKESLRNGVKNNLVDNKYWAANHEPEYESKPDFGKTRLD